jgi:hypothetical protein
MRSLVALAIAGLTLTCAALADADFRITITSKGSRPASVRNQPRQYLLANVPDGTTMTVQRTSGHWLLGRIGGAIDRCGWVERRGKLHRTHVKRRGSRCRSPLPHEFTNGTKNSRPRMDGAVARLYTGRGCSSVTGYTNVFPWRAKASPTGQLPGLEEGMRVLWRYVSHDGRFVLVREQVKEGAWFFVPIGCVAAGRNPGCFPGGACPVSSRRAVSRTAAARFQTAGTTVPFVYVARSKDGSAVEVRGEDRCQGVGASSAAFHFKKIILDRHGRFRGRAAKRGWRVDGHFEGAHAIGSFRVHQADCDTGDVQFDVPRRAFKISAAAAGVPSSSQVVPGERVGAVRIGMTKRTVDGLLDRGRRGAAPGTYYYDYPKVSIFEVIYRRGRVAFVETNGRRFDFGGVRLGQRVRKIKSRLKTHGLSRFSCRGLNGRVGYRHGRHSDLTYDLDPHHRKLDFLSVGHDVTPSCE